MVEVGWSDFTANTFTWIFCHSHRFKTKHKCLLIGSTEGSTMSFNLSRPSDINFLFGIMTDYDCQFLFNTIKRIYLTLLTGLTDITKKTRNKMERSSETQ